MVDERILEVRWMVGENGRPQSMTLQRYQRGLAGSPVLIKLSKFMQDGATSHTTDLNSNFLIDLFQERAISL